MQDKTTEIYLQKYKNGFCILHIPNRGTYFIAIRTREGIRRYMVIKVFCNIKKTKKIKFSTGKKNYSEDRGNKCCSSVTANIQQ